MVVAAQSLEKFIGILHGTLELADIVVVEIWANWAIALAFLHDMFLTCYDKCQCIVSKLHPPDSKHVWRLSGGKVGWKANHNFGFFLKHLMLPAVKNQFYKVHDWSPPWSCRCSGSYCYGSGLFYSRQTCCFQFFATV